METKSEDVRRRRATKVLHTKERRILSDHIFGVPIKSLIIDSHKVRDVAIFDVPGAYLNADMIKEKFIILKIEGEFVDIMC